MLKKFTISAALLPSLQAEYCMERVTSRGVTGGKAKFVIDLPKHSLSFATKIQENYDNLETNLPSEGRGLGPMVKGAPYVCNGPYFKSQHRKLSC